MNAPQIITVSQAKVADEYIIKFHKANMPVNAARVAVINAIKAHDPDALIYEMDPALFDGIIARLDAPLFNTLKTNTAIEYLAENMGDLAAYKASTGLKEEGKIPAPQATTRKPFPVNQDIQRPDQLPLAMVGLQPPDLKNMNKNPVFSYPATAGVNVDIFILDSGLAIQEKVVSDELPNGGPSHTVGFSAILGESAFTDATGHGSWMASIVGGVNNGVAKRSNIIPVKVESQNKSTSAAHLFIAIDWVYKTARNKKASIISASGGAPKFSPLDDLYKQLDAEGFYLVVAAGQVNPAGEDVANLSPTGSGYATVVGGFGTMDKKKYPPSNFGPLVNFWAPATTVCALQVANIATTSKNFEGTSPAAALISGVIALWVAELLDTDLKLKDAPSSKAYVLDAIKNTAYKVNVTGVPAPALLPHAPTPHVD